MNRSQKGSKSRRQKKTPRPSIETMHETHLRESIELGFCLNAVVEYCLFCCFSDENAKRAAKYDLGIFNVFVSVLEVDVGRCPWRFAKFKMN